MTDKKLVPLEMSTFYITSILVSAPQTEISGIFSETNQQFSKEVEDEANSYFQRIYNQPPHPTMSINEVLDMLKRFKDSSNKKEKVRKFIFIPSSTITSIYLTKV